jgi:membrane peptidoglycan carboxypeptidase
MERRLSKEKILDYYLNLVEWGPGVYGIGEASRKYFGISPTELSPEQAALLAFFIPSPKARVAAWENGTSPEIRNERIGWTLRQMTWQGYLRPLSTGDSRTEPPNGEGIFSNSSSDANLKHVSPATENETNSNVLK